MTENGPLYPREPRYNSACTKLPRYRLKQYESFLTMSRNIVANSLNAGKSWVTPMGVKRRDIPGKAEKKQPLSFGCGGGADQVLVFFAWPFVDSPEWNVKLKIASGQERGVKMHCQWPMFRVFKKGNPGHGLPTPPR